MFPDTLELDMATVQPSLAGPKRPQDRVLLRTASDRQTISTMKMADERTAKNPSAERRCARRWTARHFQVGRWRRW